MIPYKLNSLFSLVNRFVLTLVVFSTLFFSDATSPFLAGVQVVGMRNNSSTSNDSKRDAASSGHSKTTEQNADSILRDYSRELENLAASCDERGMEDEAAYARSLIYPTGQDRFIVPFLPSKALDEPRDDNEPRRLWRERLNSLRTQYANKAFSRVEHFRQNEQGCDIIGCAYETLWINPDHAEARKILGYSLKDGVWRSQWELTQLAKGLVDSPEFGWIPKSQLERYRAGERFYRQKWITAKEEEENIVTSGSGWLVETEHFSILSRVSLERGVEVGRFLERHYQTLIRLFYRLVATDAQIVARLYSDMTGIQTKRLRVMLFRNRQEYLRETKDDQTVGVYVPSLKCLLTYEPNESARDSLFSTLAHEATHQFFGELSIAALLNKSRDSIGESANFWVVEGVAVFFETFRINDEQTYATIGGYRDVGRIQRALDSVLVEKTYVPLEKYVRMTRDEFQKSPDVHLLYNQAAGLAFFFLQYQNGKYRNAFLAYLHRVYSGTDAPNTLEETTGKTFAELDAEYASFMRGLWRDAK